MSERPPIEGEIRYMNTPMGLGWYIFKNGNWIYDDSGYFDGAPTAPPPCYHVYKEYIGFTDRYMYCVHCDEKMRTK